MKPAQPQIETRLWLQDGFTEALSGKAEMKTCFQLQVEQDNNEMLDALGNQTPRPMPRHPFSSHGYFDMDHLLNTTLVYRKQ